MIPNILKFVLVIIIVAPISFFATLWLLPAPDKSAATLLTKGKQVTLSSYWADRKYPKGAIDGVINGKYGFSTQKEQNPWWQINLEGIAQITSIEIYNRTDCCMELARKLVISVSDDGKNWKRVYVHDGSVFGGSGKLKPLSLEFDVPVEGQFVRLSLDDFNFFHLDEVKIRGKIVAYRDE